MDIEMHMRLYKSSIQATKCVSFKYRVTNLLAINENNSVFKKF